jgi:hypothetical protein
VGSFYTNVALVHADPESVAAWCTERGHTALILGTDRWVVVFDRDSEAQDGTVVERAHRLSDEFASVAVAATDHDDDILWLDLFQSGALLDHYDSSPGFFGWDGQGAEPLPDGGDGLIWSDTLGGAIPEIEGVFRGEYDFAHDRHRALAQLVGLPTASCGYGYDYLTDGDLPEGVTTDDLLHADP